METNQLMLMGLVALAAGGVLYAFVYPWMTGQFRAEKRQQALVSGTSKKDRRAADNRAAELAQRRRQITESLKDIDVGKAQRVTLEMKIKQAGLTWTKPRFFIISAVIGMAIGFVFLIVSANPLYALGGALIGGLGIPNWLLGYMRKRRIDRFIQEFPNAVEVIIRGIKAGLPLNDCLRIIASEAAEPVRSEFRAIVESQTLGLTIGQSVERLAESIPAAEANFFSIVINIQQNAGGNLSEALGNLARVLRERKKMKIKIKAMSSEAKASASIIGALPFLVSGMVYLSSPGYISLLWTTSGGRTVMAVCAIWMAIGIMSMKKMISFDF